ncbi:cytochrome c [Rhizobium sp. RU20A]|uniref:c-type cytochrome n=1 Tax=Rhizobium sp. RU20A TaxID=1907412 RepID=UPI0009544FC1|nr:cytochrome c family protein [Rhizobium sp. RU20A]SIR43549.1 cytochrome c [Rhizobium sp. RU20A]
MSKLIAFTISIACLTAPTLALAQAGDADAGKKVFNKCMACHNVDTDKAKVGPSLKGLIGRQPGTVEGYKYSTAMVEFGQGKTWDEALLKAYLPDPKGMVKGTKMAFPGLKDPKDVDNVIAYIKTFSTAN